jgi:hypothetical protein
MPMLQIAAIESTYLEALVRIIVQFGIPGLLVVSFWAVPHLRQYVPSGRVGKAMYCVLWALLLVMFGVTIVKLLGYEVQRKFVVDGTITGLDDSDELRLDDPDSFQRKLRDDAGRAQYDWAIITSYPLHRRLLSFKVVDAQGNQRVSCNVYPNGERLDLRYNAATQEMEMITGNGAASLSCETRETVHGNGNQSLERVAGLLQ